MSRKIIEVFMIVKNRPPFDINLDSRPALDPGKLLVSLGFTLRILPSIIEFSCDSLLYQGSLMNFSKNLFKEFDRNLRLEKIKNPLKKSN